jgi:hypothetical protein
VDGAISYGVGDPEDEPPLCDTVATEPKWNDVLSLFDARIRDGRAFAINFYWEGRWDDEGIHVTCVMHQPDALYIFPDASAPLLVPAQRLTDFSWLLRRTALPLAQAGHDLWKIECCDSR